MICVICLNRLQCLTGGQDEPSLLRWFYVAVQFVMLAVSIPKVALLFHAYDTETMGPLVGGVDLRSWLVGVAIDLTATFTTWAAMAKYEESRPRNALVAPALIILFCTTLSVVANYEDAATKHPAQYAHIALFSNPALLINPILISAPPVLVLLLILLVPSVLATPRVKTAAEIEAEAEEAEARIAAEARIREAKARASARVLEARVKGIVETVSAVTNRPDAAEVSDTPEVSEEAPPFPTRLDEPESPTNNPTGPTLPVAQAKVTRAMWQAMKLPERVQQSGIITPQEIADALDISLSHARNLTKGVESGRQTVHGRTGVSYLDLIDTLYESRAKNSYIWARTLESTLGVRKRNRALQVVPNDPNDEREHELEEEVTSERGDD